MRDIEKDALASAPFHLRVDRPGDNVARSEFPLRMMLLHEASALCIEQNAAFAAHGLRDEKRLGLGMVKAGRMELDELHVRNQRPGAPCHRHSVAGGDIRIRGIEIDLTASAGCEHVDIASQSLHLTAALVEHIHAHTAVLHRITKFSRGQEINRHVILQNRDIRMRGDLSDKGSLDLEPGEILEVQHPSLGMPALAGEIEFTNAVLEFPFVEVHPELHEFLNAGRPFRDDGAHHVLVAKTRARNQRVANVEVEGIFLAHHTSHSALCPCRIRIRQHPLGHERYGTLLCRLQREREPGYSAANDDEIKLSHFGRKMTMRAYRVTGARFRGTAMLSIKRALPRKTATARRIGREKLLAGSIVSASTSSR